MLAFCLGFLAACGVVPVVGFVLFVCAVLNGSFRIMP